MIKDILSYGIRDITQKKHSVLRNYPVVGRLRYFFEQLGEYFRQYFFSMLYPYPEPKARMKVA
jgi:hypothetical protein